MNLYQITTLLKPLFRYKSDLYQNTTLLMPLFRYKSDLYQITTLLKPLFMYKSDLYVNVRRKVRICFLALGYRRSSCYRRNSANAGFLFAWHGKVFDVDVKGAHVLVSSFIK